MSGFKMITTNEHRKEGMGKADSNRNLKDRNVLLNKYYHLFNLELITKESRSIKINNEKSKSCD